MNEASGGLRVDQISTGLRGEIVGGGENRDPDFQLGRFFIIEWEDGVFSNEFCDSSDLKFR